MERKIVLGIMLTLLLIGMLMVTFNLTTAELDGFKTIEPVEANGVSITQYDWPVLGYDPAGTSFSPSSAPNTNTTAWIADLPGGTVWAHPVVAEGKVFIGAGGYLNAFDENNGSLLWSFRAPAQPGYPVVAAVADGRVFFGTAEPGPGGAVYALNTTTSEQIWNYTTEGYLRPLVVVEDRLYFGVDLNSTGKTYCINATDGAHIWNYTTQDKGITVAVAYSKVYLGCGHWITSAKAAIYCLDMYDGSFVWSFDTGRDLGGLGSVDNGKVYLAASYEGYNHIVYALNATNGDVVWSTTRYSSGEGASSFAVAYGKVFFGTGRGAKGVYALNETNGDEIWAFPLSSGAAAGGPVVADGKVFFAEGNPSHTVYVVNETTGTVLWSYNLGGSVHSRSSAVANGRVFVADHYDPKLYAFGAGAPPSPKPGDVNDDGIVDIIDGVIIGVAFGSKPGDPKWNPIADIVPDNFIDIQDIVLWAIHFGEDC